MLRHILLRLSLHLDSRHIVYVVENKNPHNLAITRILGCPMGFEPMTFRTTI